MNYLKTEQVKIVCPECKKSYIHIIPEYDDLDHTVCPHCGGVSASPNKIRDAINSFSTTLYLSNDCKPISNAHRSKELENISKLMTQMTRKCCRNDDMVDIVKYSLVCVDSNKYRNGACINIYKAYKDFHVSELFDKYIGSVHSVFDE